MAVSVTGLPTQLTKGQCDTLRKQLIKLQGGRCALCEAYLKDVGGHPALDHDHQSGLIRGVLCANCNGMEGQVYSRATRAKRKRTAREWLISLLDYWEYHQANPSKYIYYNHGKPKKRPARVYKTKPKKGTK